jgi:hypothetical protein
MYTTPPNRSPIPKLKKALNWPCKSHKNHENAALKTQVAIEALKERETLADPAFRVEVYATMLSKWKRLQ